MCGRDAITQTVNGVEVFTYHDKRPPMRMLCPNSKKPVYAPA